MKKLILLLSILFISAVCAAYMNPGMHGNIGHMQGGATDYTADPNCKAAFYMNGGLSANGDDETDRSGNGETLIEESGDIPNSVTVPAGYSGKSRDFTIAETETLMRTDGCDISGNALSIVFWMKSDVDPSADQGLIYKWLPTDNNRQYRVYWDELPGCIRAELSSDGTGTAISCKGATDVITGAWAHIAVVYNNTDVRLYVNGAVDTNGDFNPAAYAGGITSKDGNLYIGSGNQRNQPFDGLIDEVAFFDRALSATEVLEIYNNGISGNKGGND